MKKLTVILSAFVVFALTSGANADGKAKEKKGECAMCAAAKKSGKECKMTKKECKAKSKECKTCPADKKTK